MRYLIFILIPFLSFSQVKLKGYELTDSTQNNVVLKDDNTTKVLKGFVLNGSLDAPPPVTPPDGPTCSDGIQNGDETGIDCGGSCPPCSSVVQCTGGTAGSIVPTSAADFENAIYTNYTFTINNSLDISGRTVVSGARIVAGTGVLSGTGIDVTTNDVCITDSYDQIFATSARFSAPYSNSRLSFEAFGAIPGDQASDDAAIEASIRNCEYIRGQINGVYTKNLETSIRRTGIIDIDFLNATIRTNDAFGLSHGVLPQNEGRYLFQLYEFDDVIFNNGNFDGRNLASRCILLREVRAWSFEGLNIYDYFAPDGAYARGVAVLLEIFPETIGFERGYMNNCVIERIGAFSDGNFNNAPFGVSKGIWLKYHGTAYSPKNITFSNNTVTDIYGDDAEGFYNSPGDAGFYRPTLDQVNVLFDNETYLRCERRAFKINGSNVTIRNSYIESTSTLSFAASVLINVFSISGGAGDISNINILNNEIVRVGNSLNGIISFTDVNGVTVTGNTLTAQNYIDNANRVSFGADGNQCGLYDGTVANLTFSNNTMNNVGMWFETHNFNPSNLVIDSNTMTWELGEYRAETPVGIIEFYNLGGKIDCNLQPLPDFLHPNWAVTISNMDITINYPVVPSSLFAPVLSRNLDVTNTTFDNVNITHTGPNRPAYAFGLFNSNLDSSNSILNCNITGMSGTNGVTVLGANQSVIINNSFGDGTPPTPITTQ